METSVPASAASPRGPQRDEWPARVGGEHGEGVVPRVDGVWAGTRGSGAAQRLLCVPVGRRSTGCHAADGRGFEGS